MAEEKQRISVTLTKAYLDRIDRLMRAGMYFYRGSAIMAGLRLLFEVHEIPLIPAEEAVE